MKILWVKSDFLHPTERGGQIRTLEMLRRLHRRHEIHYVAFANRELPEGPQRAHEYCSYAYPVEHVVPPRGSARFLGQLAGSLLSPLPLSISRYGSAAMRNQINLLTAREEFDNIVCDFVIPAQNLDCLDRAVLFQHNVETLIWRRHAENARGLAARLYFQAQARRMFQYENAVCRAVQHVVTVSEADACWTRKLFALTGNVSAVPTGVDVAFFTPPEKAAPFCDLIFLGSMDWMPNIDGVVYFVEHMWPRLRAEHPECTLGIVGRNPAPDLRRLAESDPGIKVTGTVGDVRPYLWGSRVSIVPLRIGGGTRLKIYESMAAGVPVVSTSIGAEGLPVEHPTNIRLADTPETFARECGSLLAGETARRQLGSVARQWVSSHFSWDAVVDCFERVFAQAGTESNIIRPNLGFPKPGTLPRPARRP